MPGSPLTRWLGFGRPQRDEENGNKKNLLATKNIKFIENLEIELID
jgi:hypothetical protein